MTGAVVAGAAAVGCASAPTPTAAMIVPNTAARIARRIMKTTSARERETPAGVRVLKGKVHRERKELPRVIDGKRLVAGKRDAVAYGERHVTRQLPVQEHVGFPRQKAVVRRRLVDRGALV